MSFFDYSNFEKDQCRTFFFRIKQLRKIYRFFSTKKRNPIDLIQTNKKFNLNTLKQLNTITQN